jgi:PKD repeat protein
LGKEELFQPDQAFVFLVLCIVCVGVSKKTCYFQHVFHKEGDYNVQLKAFNGIKTIVAETIIHVNGDILPESFLDISKNTLKPICPGTEVYFQTDWNQNYRFDYGDGYTGISGVHAYNDSGVYLPTVTVKNACGNEVKIGAGKIGRAHV